MFFAHVTKERCAAWITLASLLLALIGQENSLNQSNARLTPIANDWSLVFTRALRRLHHVSILSFTTLTPCDDFLRSD